jgi:hypothetical protein
MFEWWQLALLGLVGCIAGFLNVMAGGGSLLAMPMMLFMGLPGATANGTNRLAILLQNLSGAASFYRQGIHRIRESLLLASFAVPGSILGAMLGARFSGIWFKRFLAIVMVTMLVLMFLKKKKHAAKRHPDHSPHEGTGSKRRYLGLFLLLLAGFYGGIIQAGVGFVMILILNRVMGYDLVTTNAHKVIIIAAYTVPAMIIFGLEGEIRWLPAAVLAVGNGIGAWFGAAFAVQRGERLVRFILLTALTVITVLLVYRSFVP